MSNTSTQTDNGVSMHAAPTMPPAHAPMPPELTALLNVYDGRLKIMMETLQRIEAKVDQLLVDLQRALAPRPPNPDD